MNNIELTKFLKEQIVTDIKQWNDNAKQFPTTAQKYLDRAEQFANILKAFK